MNSDSDPMSYTRPTPTQESISRQALARESGEGLRPLNPVFEAWAIRHKTGAFLPMRWGHKNHPHSCDEPTPGAFPRLFKSARAANMALTRWLEGRWKDAGWGLDYGPSLAGNPPVEMWEGLTVEPVEGRNREDMEVVRVVLKIDMDGAQFR